MELSGEILIQVTSFLFFLNKFVGRGSVGASLFNPSSVCSPPLLYYNARES